MGILDDLRAKLSGPPQYEDVPGKSMDEMVAELEVVEPPERYEGDKLSGEVTHALHPSTSEHRE
jgi:hypothetical protein